MNRPPEQTDVVAQRILAGGLVFCVVAAVVGVLYLTFEGHPVPPILGGIATSALFALTSRLSMASSRQASPPTPTLAPPAASPPPLPKSSEGETK